MSSTTKPWRSTTPLCDATVQEIQLELIRRTQHNAFDGQQVAESLLRNRGLWTAVLLDSVSGGGSMIKLRDLADNIWNVDELFVLCQTRPDAQAIAQLAIDDAWHADVIEPIQHRDAIARMLGTSDELFVVRFWWD